MTDTKRKKTDAEKVAALKQKAQCCRRGRARNQSGEEEFVISASTV